MAIDPVSKAVITAALIATQYAIAASQKFEGPRLSELNVTGADYGTVIPKMWGTRRLECTIFFAEALKEVKRRNKTKGGKFNEYQYFGTWAVAICDNEIQGVTKIWFDKHLIYDNTGAGPQFPFTFSEKLSQQKRIQNNIRIYNGDSSQLPDPRMEATVNGEFGADSCPAYRGLSYIMFEEIPLEKFGNRLPLVSVEVTGGTDAVFPIAFIPGTERGSLLPSMNRLFGTWLDLATETLFVAVQNNWARLDMVTQSVLEFGTLPIDISVNPCVGVQSNGDLWVADSIVFQELYHFYGPNFQFYETIELPNLVNGSVQLFEIEGQVLVCMWGASPVDRCLVYHAGLNIFVYNENTNFVPAFFARRGDQIWAFGAHGATSTSDLEMLCVYGGPVGTQITVTWPEPMAVASRVNMGVIYYEPDDTWIIAVRDSLHGYFCKVDPDTGNILLQYEPLEMDVFGISPQMNNYRGGPTFWTGYETFQQMELDLETLTPLRIIDWLDWSNETLDNALYIPSINALFSQGPNTGNRAMFRFLDRIAPQGTTLRTICEDIAEAVNAEADSDYTAFTQPIKGFSTTQGPAKSTLEPLITLHDADIRPHNFGLQGVVRGSAAGTSVPTRRLVVEGESRYKVERASETDLPQRVDVTFADTMNDQQPNTATAIRRQADSQRTANVNADNYAEDPDTAIQLVERYIRRRWYEQEAYDFSLPRTYIAFEPADVITLQLDDLERTIRIETMQVGANGILSFRATRDAPSLALLSGNSGASAEGQTPDTIAVFAPSQLVLADVPLVQDIDDTTTPFLYFGLGPMGAGSWPGADIWQADINVPEDFNPGWAAASSDQAATIGFTQGSLGDAVPEVFDYGNTVQVVLWSGSLESVTQQELLEDDMLNLAIIGSEIVQFRTASLQGDGSYILSGFLRGRRGTEASAVNHLPGDTFMLVDSSMLRRSMGAGELGDTDYYRGVTSGRSFDGALTRSVSFTGAANKPYSPAQVTLLRDTVSEDWDIEWVRRTRIGGNNINGSDVPLGESSESYEVDIMNGSTVVRTLTSTSPSVTYTQAQQVTDFGSAQTSLTVRVYQMSSVVGRGFATEKAA
jgi:hypothetical protein